METSEGVSALLRLEDEAPQRLFDTVPGTDEPIWPHIRMAVAHALAAAELGTEAVSSGGSVSVSRLMKRYLSAYLPQRRLPHRSGRPGLVFLVGGTTIGARNGRGFNWLVDDFAAADPSSVIIQSRPLAWRPWFRETYSMDLALARLDVIGRIRPTSPPPIDAIRAVVEDVGRRLTYPLAANVAESIIRQGAYTLSRYSRVNDLYLRSIDRLNTDVVLVEDGSYGGHASVIRALRRRGIRVAEPQHGWIGPSHAAYNFGSAMRSPELVDTLPEVLLTFGDFWSANVRHPAEVISVGKPHMDDMRRGLPPFRSRPRTVLVVSSIARPEEASEFVLQLRRALAPEWRVVFRPHPSERPVQEQRYPRLAVTDGIEFDSHSDVYVSMKAARAVVGVASTVLYEALAFGCHVFVRDSPYARYYLDEAFGEVVATDAQFSAMVETLQSDAPPALTDVALESYWKPGAIANFAEFVAGQRVGTLGKGHE